MLTKCKHGIETDMQCALCADMDTCEKFWAWYALVILMGFIAYILWPSVGPWFLKVMDWRVGV